MIGEVCLSNLYKSLNLRVVLAILCSNSWRYDGENSPNGGRRDLCVSDSVKLIDFSALKMPTLVIYGDRDPYINFECIDDEAEFLPEGSSVDVIPGASHVAFILSQQEDPLL